MYQEYKLIIYTQLGFQKFPAKNVSDIHRSLLTTFTRLANYYIQNRESLDAQRQAFEKSIRQSLESLIKYQTNHAYKKSKRLKSLFDGAWVQWRTVMESYSVCFKIDANQSKVIIGRTGEGEIMIQIAAVDGGWATLRFH